MVEARQDGYSSAAFLLDLGWQWLHMSTEFSSWVAQSKCCSFSWTVAIVLSCPFKNSLVPGYLIISMWFS